VTFLQATGALALAFAVLGLVLLALAPLVLDLLRRRTPSVIQIEDSTIMIVPQGFFRWLAPEVGTPIDALVGVFVVRRQELGPAGLSRPKTRLPEWLSRRLPGLLAGTFQGPGGSSLWLCGQRARAIRMDFSRGPYDYAVVQVRDPEATIHVLRAISRQNTQGLIS
jgi:hypothetical protein